MWGTTPWPWIEADIVREGLLGEESELTRLADPPDAGKRHKDKLVSLQVSG